MVWADCAIAGVTVGMTGAIEANKAPPKRRQAKLSPRYARTHIFMRNEPSSPTDALPQGPHSQPRRLYKLFSPRFNRSPPADHAFPSKRCMKVTISRPNPVKNGEQPRNVVVGGENQQHQHDRKTDAEPDFLGALRERPPAQPLEAVEQKVAAIEQRDREQVQQPNRDRDRG